VTEAEVVRTAADRLARHIAFDVRLSIANLEDIVDQDLADRGEFVPDPEDLRAYVYNGDRWAIEYRTGRPRLVEAIEVGPHPVGPETAWTEKAFARLIELIDCVGPPMPQEQIDHIREEVWADRFRQAAERDAAGAVGGDSDETEEVTDRGEG